MFFNTRLVLAAAACFLLTNCQLINSALQLAPLLLLVEDKPEDVQGRAKKIEQRGIYHSPRLDAATSGQQMAAR